MRRLPISLCLVSCVAALLLAEQQAGASSGARSDESAESALGRPLSRRARWARKLPARIQLAARPRGRPSSTSTSTSTSSSSEAREQPEESSMASAAGGGGGGGEAPKRRPEEAGADEPDSSGDYEELEGGSSAAGKLSSTSPPTTTTTTTTTTTSARPTRRKPASNSRRPPGRPSSSTTTTPSSTTSVEEEQEEQEEEQEEEQQEQSVTSARPAKARERAREPQLEAPLVGGAASASANANANASKPHHQRRRRPLVALPFIKPKNESVCISEAFLEFPRDLFGDKWRSRGLVLVHVLVVCYMFYSLALVCERYFMPSLEEFAQRLKLSEDVAGATLMSAGSSAPELFTAILGVFVAKGDVGTGAIVGSAVFNILFVIGLCAFVSATSAQLQWWPVLRDSLYYTLTVLVLILIIYDERVTALESASMLALYGVYILIMANNEALKEAATRLLASSKLGAKLLGLASCQPEGPDDVFGSSSSSGGVMGALFGSAAARQRRQQQQQQAEVQMETRSKIEEDSMYMAALLIIVKHKRLFRANLRFQSAARYVIVKMQHRRNERQLKASLSNKQQTDEADYFESNPLRSSGAGATSAGQRAKMQAYAHGASVSKNKFSIVSRDEYEFWNMPPAEGENYYLWLARIPVNYVLHYTVPDCTLYPDKYLFTFFISIIWTAFFSYIMVWMVTLIGYTFGIPDSVMGVTFLAAGTSVPDCYSSIHAARNGMADMAVSNSIGSNVFDILIGLAVPWFIQSAIYPGVVATINSRGVIYSVILLFLSLIVTIYLLNKYEWTLQPRLGLALLIAYGLFIALTCMLEFNLFGHVNPPPCPVPPDRV